MPYQNGRRKPQSAPGVSTLRGKSIVVLTMLVCCLLTLSAGAWQDPVQPDKKPDGTRPAGVRAKRKTTRPGEPARGPRKAGDRPDAAQQLNNALPPLAVVDFNLGGLVITVEPESQTVPKNTATIINTGVLAPEGANTSAVIAGLNPNWRVRGELSGPSLSTPLPLEAAIGQPLIIPPLPNVGDHSVQNLRVVDTGASGQPVVQSVTPDACGIVVIEQILVSEVRVNQLTYEQIVQSGINITNDNYNYFNFTLAFATSSGTQQISIPAAFPPVGPNNAPPIVGAPTQIGPPGTFVPGVLPVMLEALDAGGNPVPMNGEAGGGAARIPGLIVFPGRIGLLHQFFEAILIVSNGAPNGTPLVVRDLSGRIRLPDNATPGNEADDPLRIADTQLGGRVSQLALHGLGADNTYGTADDTARFTSGQSGQATFLLEGLREGLHNINFDIEGMLDGLPIGPVRLRGAASGAVLVRDASFSVTFTHPSIVRAGQEYDLGLTLYNSGTTLITGAFAELARSGIIGATLLGTETQRQFQGTVRPGQVATVKWRLRANVTGQITASYVKVGENIGAGLNLVTGVGDRNVPLSPDSLILPDEVAYLPPDVVERARELLGQAWSIANAPPGGLPAGVTRLGNRVVIDRAVELGVAGLRVEFGETPDVSLNTFWRDWLGELQGTPHPGFGDALRNTPAGYRLFDCLGGYYYQRLNNGRTPGNLLQDLVEAEAPRSPFVAALVSQTNGQPLLGAQLLDARGKRVGYGASVVERFGDLVTAGGFHLGPRDVDGNLVSSSGQMLLASRVSAENWTLELNGWQNGAADVTVLFPGLGRTYQRVSFNGVNITTGGRYRVIFKPTVTSALAWQAFQNGAWQNVAGVVPNATVVDEAAPRLVGALQVTPEVLGGGDKYGRLVGLLFSKPMARTQAETANRYTFSNGVVAGTTPPEDFPGRVTVTRSRLDLGDRFVFMSLDKPVGPFVERRLSVSGLADKRGLVLPSPTETPVAMRVSPNGDPPGAFATGRVLNPDGTPVSNAQVFHQVQECDGGIPLTIAIAKTDSEGKYYFDYVRGSDCGGASFTAVHPQTQSSKTLFVPLLFHGQRVALDFVFLARGKVRGTVYLNNGAPLARARVQLIPELDVSTSKVVETDLSGQYEARDLAVGPVSVRAVAPSNTNLDPANATGLAAGVIEGPGQTATINVTLQSLAGEVSGRIVFADGSPLPEHSAYLLTVFARIPGFSNEPLAVAYAQISGDGSFRFRNLPASEITLEVIEASTGAGAQQTVSLTPASPVVANILLSLPGRGAVSGQVLDDTGQPVPNAQVRAAGRAVRADANGLYSFTNLPEGLQTLSATDTRTGLTGALNVQIRVGQTVSNANIFVSRPGVLNGTVYRRQNGVNTPAAGVIVTPDGVQRVLTNAQGQYTISGVATNTPFVLRFVDATRKLAVNVHTTIAPGETVTRNAVLSSGSLHGRITQPDGVTATLAQVRVNYQVPGLASGSFFGLLRDDLPLSLQTGADGLYALPNINVGAFRVSASNAFFPVQVSTGGELLADEDEEVNISLTDTLAGKIQGRVYQPDGVTPAGAGVQVTISGGSLAAATVPTIADGSYEFPEVFAAGSYLLTATAPTTGYTNRITISAERNRDTIADVRLRGRGAMRVRVLDGAGQPAQRGSVNLSAGAYPNETRYQEISPAQGGVITFAGLTEGDFAVSAQQNGLGGRGSITVQRDMTVEIILQLQASGTVTGRVFQADGVTPVGLADVTLRLNGRQIGFSVTADDETERGKFSFAGVPTGDFTLAVFDNRTGRAGRGAGRLTQQGQTANVSVNLLASGTVSGHVTANNAPVNHALVTISAEGSGITGLILQATTDPDGSYRFYGIPAGRFTVTVTDAPGGQAGSVNGQVPNVAAPPVTTADITLAPTLTVTGTVYKFGGTEPLAGAYVNLTSNGQGFAAFTNSNGVYRLSFVPLGSIRARANAPSGNDRGESATVTANQPGATITLNLTLAGLGNVSGNALDNNGAPLTFGTVTLTNSDWGSATVFSTGVQNNGRFTFNNVPVGNFALRLTVPNRVGVGTAGGSLSAGQNAEVNIQLDNAASITGRAVDTDGVTPVAGADVTLYLTRPGGELTFSTHTDSQGVWTYNNLPLGVAIVIVEDLVTGRRARVSDAQLTTNGQILDVGTMILREHTGIVTGFIYNTDNLPAAGAQVTLNAANGVFNATAGADGRYIFNSVGVGSFTLVARNSDNTLRGTADGTISGSFAMVNRNINLQALGNINGTVFQADGTTPAAGARVSLNRVNSVNGLVTVTNAQGRYEFSEVQLGAYLVDVNDTATGDRGRANVSLLTANETQIANVTLNGLGRVVVTVRNSANNLVSGANVTVISQTQFSSSQNGVTQADGTATFARVLAGSFFVTARDPQTGLSGTAGGNSVAGGGTTNVAVTLQPAGTIRGRVFGVDGTTLQANANVRLLLSNNNLARQTQTAADGSYSFAGVALGSYNLEVLDANSVARARSANVTLNANGEEVVRDLTFVGLGTVTGRVLRPDGAGAGNLFVILRSLHPTLGVYLTTSTNVSGNYTVNNVPVGSFVASAADGANQLQGETTGQIAQHGQTVTADIQLASNAVNFPQALYDGNGAYFNLQGNGRVGSGLNNVFIGDFAANQGGFLLDVYANGAANRFTGGNVGTQEDGGREIAVQQNNLAGLNVTRKIYVPRNGYFTRYVEMLNNPTNAPLTVDVRVLSHARNLASYGPPRLIATSSGDNQFSVANAANPDRWAVVDDGDNSDPFADNQTIPALGFAFDGAGAATRASDAAFTLSEPTNAEYAQVSYRWNSVTIPAGGTVALLHFGVQQLSRAAAQTALERLTQLPPEAVAGLSAAEIAAIRNFNVPADGVGTVAPLVSLNGQINGRVLAGDNTTPIPGASVRYRSLHPLFGRARSFTADANGAFSVTATLNDFGGTVLVPVDNFTLQGVHPNTANTTAVLNGGFAAGAAVATQNVVFAGTGVLRGFVRRHNGATVTNSGRLIFTNGVSGGLVNLLANGEFNIAGVAAGSYTLRALVNHPQGLGNEGAGAAVIVAGQTTAQDVLLNPAGAVTGFVYTGTGAPAVNQTVNLRASNIGCGLFSCAQRVAQTAADGSFTFTDVAANPNGPTYRLEARESFTGILSQVELNVAADQTVTQNLNLVAYGNLQVLVTDVNGVPVLSSRVFLQKEATGPSFTEVGFTNASGRLNLSGVPAGNFTVRAYQPGSSAIFSNTTGRLNTQGETVSVTAMLPGQGNINGLVTLPGGAPVANSRVTIHAPEIPERTAYTNAAGVYTFAQVQTGHAFTVRAYYPNGSGVYREQTNAVITQNGGTLTVNLSLPGLATVRVTVLRANGNPYVGANVYLQNITQQYPDYVGTTDGNGQVDTPEVPEGNFTVAARNSGGALLGSANGAVQAADAGQIVPFTLNLPPAGTVRGTIFAGDGQTPLTQGLTVEIFDGPATNPLYQTYIYDGNYQFDDVAVGAAGYRVVAHSPLDYSVTATATGQPNPDAPVTANLTLPVSVISGAVTFSDGAPVPNPNVYVFQELNGSNQTYYAGYNDANGLYRVFGVQIGAFTLTAQDGATSLTANAAGSVANVAAPVTLNISLPAAGTVNGRVTKRDSANNPVGVPNAYVILELDETGFQRTANADANGNYLFERVVPGSFTVQAEDADNNPGLRGSAEGASVAGNTATVNITLPDTGQVTGLAYRADGVTPLANANITLTTGGLEFEREASTSGSGVFTFAGIPLGPFSLKLSWYDYLTEVTQTAAAHGNLTTANGTATVNIILPQRGTVTGIVRRSNGNPSSFTSVEVYAGASFQGQTHTNNAGEYTVDNVPFGPLRVVAEVQFGFNQPAAATPQTTLNGPNFNEFLGVAQGLLNGSTANIDVNLGGEYLTYCANFDGLDGFRYDLCANGSIGNGGLVAGGPSAFNGSGALRLNGAALPDINAAEVTDNDRVVNAGPIPFGNLQVKREVYVPETGGFARYLEIIGNPTAQSVTVNVRVEHQVSSGGATRILAAPAANGNRYAVLDSSNGQTLATGFVFAGASAPTPVAATRFRRRSQVQSFNWNVTIPAGETRILMHFALQRGITDTAGATAQAEALANLSDAHALDNLSAVERANIANFSVPLSLLQRRLSPVRRVDAARVLAARRLRNSSR